MPGNPDRPFVSSSASSSGRSTTTTFPVHSHRPSSATHFDEFGGVYSSQPNSTFTPPPSTHLSTAPTSYRRRSPPPDQYLNPLFVGYVQPQIIFKTPCLVTTGWTGQNAVTVGMRRCSNLCGDVGQAVLHKKPMASLQVQAEVTSEHKVKCLVKTGRCEQMIENIMHNLNMR